MSGDLCSRVGGRPGPRNRRLGAAAVVGVLGLLQIAGCSDDPPTSGGNLPPRIVSVNVSPGSVILNGESRVTALVSDPDGDALDIAWTATGGTFADSTRTITTWRAPAAPGLYILTLSASDGTETSVDSVDVLAGNVALTVISDPPAAYINLDGAPTGLTTPRTFDPLPAGFHSVSMFSQYYLYASQVGREYVHGEHDTLRFVVDSPSTQSLDPGRTDLLEIGGVAFLPSGLGVVYAARTAAGTALYSTPLFPSASTPRGVLLAAGVRLEEPIAIGVTGPDLFFVTASESLAVMPIRDLNNDGTVDSVGAVTPLRRGYAPAVSRDGISLNERVAFGTAASELPPTSQIFWTVYSGGSLSGLELATPHTGKLATWKPDENIIAYVRAGAVFRSAMNPGNLPQADTLYAGGTNTAPAWGPWAAKMVAFLHAEGPGPFTDLMLTAQGAPDATIVYTGLSDPRFVAWSSLERAVAITQHPAGTPRLLIVRDLPIP